jgi:hypothetical protein
MNLVRDPMEHWHTNLPAVFTNRQLRNRNLGCARTAVNRNPGKAKPADTVAVRCAVQLQPHLFVDYCREFEPRFLLGAQFLDASINLCSLLPGEAAFVPHMTHAPLFCLAFLVRAAAAAFEALFMVLAARNW